MQIWHRPAGHSPGVASGEGQRPCGSTSSDGGEILGFDVTFGTRPPTLTQETMAADYLQFLQWRQGLDAGQSAAPTGMPTAPIRRPDFVRLEAQPDLHPLHWGTAARDEAESATAGPPPEWDGGTKMEFRDYKIKAKLWLRTTRNTTYS